MGTCIAYAAMPLLALLCPLHSRLSLGSDIANSVVFHVPRAHKCTHLSAHASVHMSVRSAGIIVFGTAGARFFFALGACRRMPRA